MTWIADATGANTVTVGTELTVDTPTTNGTYVFVVDCSNMALGDLVELRAYGTFDGSTYHQVWKGTYQHVQINGIKQSPPVPSGNGGKFSIKQTAGTARSFNWAVLRQ